MMKQGGLYIMKQSVLSVEMGQAICRVGHLVWSVLKNLLDKFDQQVSNEDKGKVLEMMLVCSLIHIVIVG